VAQIITVRGFTPKIGAACFLAPNATIIGDVELGDSCSVWFHTVIRGDVNFIKIGHRTNIQDGAIIHCTYKKSGTRIGNEVSIGHNAIVHGCEIQDQVLVGMGSIIMDNTVVESGTIIGAGAVVPENQILRSGYIYAGVPAKQLKKIDKEQFEFYVARTAGNYIEYANWFLK
jgi:carbonic anhydrase/acetyltransferase-like protein (isoleucine patch superfamily)